MKCSFMMSSALMQDELDKDVQLSQLGDQVAPDTVVQLLLVPPVGVKPYLLNPIVLTRDHKHKLKIEEGLVLRQRTHARGTATKQKSSKLD